MNAGHCGVSVSKLHNGLEELMSLSKFKIDVAKIMLAMQYNLLVMVLAEYSRATSLPVISPPP